LIKLINFEELSFATQAKRLAAARDNYKPLWLNEK